ncbi:5192_t:CDS:2, partial [Acaulospora colombiana]
MRALVLRASNKGKPEVSIENKDLGELPNGYARVRIYAAALNHRDEWIRQGQYPEVYEDFVLGSDGCGLVEEIKDEQYYNLLGKMVIIYPGLGWGTDERAPSLDLKVLGGPNDGTFAEYAFVPAENLVLKPEFLTPEQAAAIPVAGLVEICAYISQLNTNVHDSHQELLIKTSYRALTSRGGLQADEAVLITGGGGGCGSFSIQIAQKIGAKVYFTTGDKSKLEYLEEKLGAKGFLYTDPDWVEKFKGIDELRKSESHDCRFDLIVDSTGGEQVPMSLDLLKPAGRFVFFGETRGPPKGIPNWRDIFLKSLTLM